MAFIPSVHLRSSSFCPRPLPPLSSRRPRKPVSRSFEIGAPLPYCKSSNDDESRSQHFEQSFPYSDDGNIVGSEPDGRNDAGIVPMSMRDELCRDEYLFSQSLADYFEQRKAGQIPPPSMSGSNSWVDTWALAVDERKGIEMKNQYSTVRILIQHNFADFVPAEGCKEAFVNATLEEITKLKARTVYEVSGQPCIAESCDMSIDPPESGSNIKKSLQQGYYTRHIAKDADAMIDRVRPISDENRITRFTSVAVYYDGEHEIVASKVVNVAMVFADAGKSVIASTAALDDLFKSLSVKFGLDLSAPEMNERFESDEQRSQDHVLVGATLLRERIVREGKVLGDGILKVSSFLNHKVDTDLMEECGMELGERLRQTMPNKVLTVESTGLIAAIPTARRLSIPLVFARKSRPITISDSYQTTYRSATKGTTSELIVSCEYLESGDRVLIVDDFLAGGSTAEGLFKLARMAHAKVVGVGVLIEKLSDGGRAFLSGYDVPVESLAKVSTTGGYINVQEEKPWVSPLSRTDKEDEEEETRAVADEYYSRGADETRHELTTLESGEEDGSVPRGDAASVAWEEDSLDDLEDSLIREGRK